MLKEIQLNFDHPPIDFDKVWLHLHRLGSPLYMDTYFKTWAFKKSKKYWQDYYPTKGEFEDLYLFFKEGNWYGKYNIKSFGYVMLDYFVDKKHFDDYISKKEKLKEEVQNLWDSYDREKIKNLSTQERIDLIDLSLTMMIRSFAIDPFAPMIGEMAPDFTNWWLTQKGISGDDQKKAFHLLFASDKISETIQRQLDIKKEIDAATSEENKKTIISHLDKKFAFAKTEFSGFLPYGEEDVQKEYDLVKEMKFTTEEEIAKKNDLLKELGANDQEKWIFYLFGYCQYSRDERKEYLQKLMALADWALAELAEEFTTNINYLRAALYKEITLESLKDQAFLALLEKRYKEGIAMYWKDSNEGQYLIGEEGEKLYNSIDSKVEEKIELKGQPTFYGKVAGKIKIVNDPKEKVPDEPFILLTGMTSPDFIHFMQKSVAILTDEGGITSHAAILSRELKKPCIVGIKYGRKTLKDGDLVEVDAEKGVVTKIS